MNILKASSIIAVLLLISKIFGLIRELFIAAYFGANYIADAYSIAYILPGFALVLLGGLNGPFHSAILSVISKYYAQKDYKNSQTIVSTVILLSIFVMGIITVLGIVYAPYIIKLIGPNLPLQTSKIAIIQLQIMMPMFLVSGLLGIFYGVLNVKEHVLMPALSPIMASLSIVVALIFFYKTSPELILAYATMIGAILQLFIQFLPLLKSINKITISIDIKHPGVKDVIYILIPAVLSSTIGQINIIISSFFASGLEEGSIAAFRYANDLIQLPLGILLTALLIPYLPKMCVSCTLEDNYKSLKHDINKALRVLLRISLLTMVILFTLGEPLIIVIFQRGAFDLKATHLTYGVLFYLTISIVFYAARDLLVRVFYALQNAKIPFYCSLVSIVLYTFFNWLLYKPMGISGIALATSLVTIINFMLLGIILYYKIGKWWNKNTVTVLLYSIIYSLLVYFIGLLGNFLFFNMSNFILKLLICSVTCILMCLVFFIALILSKDNEVYEILKRLKIIR